MSSVEAGGVAGTDDHPLIIAHRGSPRRAPENTLDSFILAVREGARWLELDAHISADGVPVIIHDSTLQRTTDGAGHVSAQTAAALSRLDAGGWYGGDYAGARIPTLAEVLAWRPDGLHLMLEVKSRLRGRAMADATARAVLDAIHAGGPHDLVITSFNPHILRALRMRDGGIPLGVLQHGRVLRSTLLAQIGELSASWYVRNVLTVTRDDIAAVHDRVLRTAVFTVNTARAWMRAQSCGVDAVITNDVPAALSGFARPRSGM